MREKKIFDAITNVREDYIEEARNTKLKKQYIPWKKWAAIAAVITLLVGVGGTTLMRMLPFGGNAGGAGAGGSGHNEGTVFMSYAGPIMPLALRDVEDVSAQRNVTFDFDKQDNAHYSQDIRVIDSYVLTNNTDADITANAIYPFASSFRELYQYSPSIVVNGTANDTFLSAGRYSFASVDLNSFSSYKAMLSDSQYKGIALDDYEILNIPVIVYEFSDYKAPLEVYPAATQCVDIFSIDYSKTRILSYGFNGGGFYPEENRAEYSFFVPDVNIENYYGKMVLNKMLIVIGDDIDFTLLGYKNGAIEKGNELDDVSCSVKRYEAKLYDVLSQTIDMDRERYKSSITADERDWSEFVPQEMLLRSLSELVTPYLELDGQLPQRYDYERLDDMLGAVYAANRVFYQTFDVTIPAGQSVTVEVNMVKERSYDFYCSGSQNVGVKGFDMATTLDSNLVFTEQTASIENYENIRIVRQNFGFDPQSGITEVTLEPGIEHYYLEVKGVEK